MKKLHNSSHNDYSDSAVVLVNYNSGQHLKRTIGEVLQFFVGARIIVVDNASRDTSLEECRKAFPTIEMIYHQENVGFATAANVGARYAYARGAAQVFFINPDVTLAQECLVLLRQELTEGSLSFVSPKIMTPQGGTWFEAGRILWERMRAVHVPGPFTVEPYETGFISGCVLGVRKEAFEAIGGFDEKFFLYYEDVDLCFRAAKQGYGVGVVPQAEAVHYEVSEAHSAKKTYYLVLSGLLFFMTHATKAYRIWYSVYIALRRLKNLYNRLFWPSEEVLMVHKAYKDFFAHARSQRTDNIYHR